MNWGKVDLYKISSVESGNSAPQKKEYFIEGNLPFFRTSDVANKHITNDLIESRDFLNIRAIEDLNMKLFLKNTILFPKSGASTFLNHRAMMGIDGYVASHLSAIVPNVKLIIPSYLFYYLCTIKAEHITNSNDYPSLRLTDIEKINIPIPSLSEQKKIVEILEQADELRKKKKEVIEKSEKIITSLFYKMFGDPLRNEKGWKKIKLKDIATINPSKKNIDKDLEVSFIPMNAIDEKIGRIKKYEVRKYESVKQGFTYFEENDVLFAKITPCMENGKATIAKNLKNKIGFGSTEFHVLRANDLSTPEFLFSLIRLPIFQNIAKTNFTGTAGQQRVPTSFVENFEIILPDIELQKSFSRQLTEINEILVKNEENNLIIDNLFQNILYRAFTGELTSIWREKNKEQLKAEIADRKLTYGF